MKQFRFHIIHPPLSLDLPFPQHDSSIPQMSPPGRLLPWSLWRQLTALCPGQCGGWHESCQVPVHSAGWRWWHSDGWEPQNPEKRLHSDGSVQDWSISSVLAPSHRFRVLHWEISETRLISCDNKLIEWGMSPGRYCWGYYPGSMTCSQVS